MQSLENAAMHAIISPLSLESPALSILLDPVKGPLLPFPQHPLEVHYTVIAPSQGTG